MQYAAAGWFVVPVDPATKNPGSRLGKGWQLQSSRDPATITAWWQRWPEASLALHVGRSGAVCLDVDDPDGMPDVVWRAVTLDTTDGSAYATPFQSTRIEPRYRGHYLFAAPPGAYGNSLSGFREAGLDGWGEVRGLNAVIVVEPSSHTKPGGQYRWVTRGPLPEVPHALGALLRPPGAVSGSTATTAELNDFLSLLPGPEQCPVTQAATDDSTAQLLAMTPGGRHDYMLTAVQKLVRLGEQGHHGAAAGLEQVFTAFLDSKPDAGGSEYLDAVTGAVRNVLAAQTLPDDSGCCPAWLQQRWMQAMGFTPPPTVQPVSDGVVVLGPWTEPQPQVRNGAGKFGDNALAETFAAEALVGRYRWAAGLKWLRWDGGKWERVHDSDIVEQARLWTLGHVGAAVQLAQQAGDADDTEIKAWLAVGKSAGRLSSLAKLAQGIPGIATKAALFDADPDILNCTNGVLHLPSGELMAPDPRRLVTKQAPVTHNPNAKHPDWHAALEALPADEREWLQLRLGQAITGHMTPDDVLVICQGTGENGKGTLFKAVVEALGDYHVRLADRVLTASPDAHPTELMELRGARLATIDETPEGRQLNVVRLKKTVGSDYITARFIAQDSVTYAATHSLFVLTNYEPIVTETDHGTWRRLALLKFPYTFRKAGEPLQGPEDRHGDPGLRIRVGADPSVHSAVLAWLVDGAWAWYAAGAAQMPPHPDAVKRATEALRADSDAVYAYWEERVEPAPGYGVLAGDLLADFNQWAQSTKNMTPWGDRMLKSRFGDHQRTISNRVSHRRVKRWNGDPVLSRPASGYGQVLGAVPGDPVMWAGMRFQNSGLQQDTSKDQARDQHVYPSGHAGHTTPVDLTENTFTGDDRSTVPSVPTSGESPTDHTNPPLPVPEDSVTQGEPEAPPVKPKTKAQRLSIEAKAEAKRQAISEAAGPDVQLPAVVLRDGTVTEVTLEDAQALLEGLPEVTVDVETSGYPLGHELYELRLVQLGCEDFGVVLDPANPDHCAVAYAHLATAKVLHAHSATADLVPLAAAGLGDFDAMWERMADTVIPAKLNDPASTGADPGLKDISRHVLGSEAATKPADDARAALFTAMGCLVKPKITDPPHKNGWHSVQRNSATFVRYAGSDVLDTALISKRLPPLPGWLADRERLAAHMVSRIALTGVPIDGARVGRLLEEHTQARSAVKGTIQDRYGIDNPGSSPQLARTLTAAGIELPRTKPSAKYPEGQPSVAEGVLDSLKAHYDDTTPEGVLINDVLTYRHHNTAISLFLEPYNVMVQHGDGRARTTIYTLGADTGRMSSTRFNFQQLPQTGGFRACMSTDPGMAQISADFSSVEIRVAAEVSGDQVLLRMLDEGLDPHAMAAAIVFGPEFTKEQRYKVKRGVFGRIYGGGVKTLAEQMGVPQYVAQQLINAIDTLWPRLSEWSREITKAVQSGLMTTWTSYSGRIIHLPKDKAYAAPNYIIQGTARELLIDAMVRWRATRWGTAVMWPVHDEVDAHVPETEAAEATATLVQCMETTLPSGVRIIAEPSEPSPFWRDAA